MTLPRTWRLELLEIELLPPLLVPAADPPPYPPVGLYILATGGPDGAAGLGAVAVFAFMPPALARNPFGAVEAGARVGTPLPVAGKLLPIEDEGVKYGVNPARGSGTGRLPTGIPPAP